MKIRASHISNSSSSCYVIAVKGVTEKLDELEKLYPGLVVFVKNVMATFFSGDAITCEEDFNEYLKRKADDWGYPTVDEMLENDGDDRFDKMLEKIKDGYTVYDLRVDYGMCESMDAIIDGETIVLLENG